MCPSGCPIPHRPYPALDMADDASVRSERMSAQIEKTLPANDLPTAVPTASLL